MSRKGEFKLRNDSDRSITLQIEPDCWTFELKDGEEVIVEYDWVSEPATFQLTNAKYGGIHGAIVPGDGDITVRRRGVNILDE